MRTILIVFFGLLALGLSSAAAADQAPPLATWTLGEGTVAAAAAKPGSDIAIGQRVAATTSQPAKIVFTAPLAGSLTLSPGAGLTMVVEQVADTRELVIDLDAGAVQVDLQDKGSFAGVRVRGAALDVRVTGTLFVVQRVKRDADYVALVQGKLNAGLRRDVADALNKHQRFDIDSRQGIGASNGGGLEQVASLTNRPQIASLKKSIKEQATGAQQGDGGWNTDLALDLLNDLLDQLGLDDALIAELADALGDALFDDLNAGPGDQVINTAFSGAFGPLSPPPPPPPQ
ncbi:MAG: hypothetical protein H0W78_05120 [Planctomycetes bacterium]|nr:hypothetical protein [Planctomycetota bacterium]